MKSPEEAISWSEIYRDWEIRWQGNSPGADVLDVPLAQGPYIRPGTYRPFIDWWPSAEIPDRTRDLEKILSSTYASPIENQGNLTQGTLTTAKMLAGTQNAEESAAVWLAAAEWDMRESLPASWRGATAALLASIRVEIQSFLVGCEAGGHQRFGLWRGNMRQSLPESIMTDTLPEFVHPRTRAHVVELAHLAVSLVRARWTIVRVIPPSSDDPRARRARGG